MPRPDRAEIIARLPMAELVAELVPDLAGPGVNKRAPCLWHEQRGRAMVVNIATGEVYCHNPACEMHRGGSVFDLNMKVRGVDIGTTFRDLAQRAGLSNGHHPATASADELMVRNESLLEAQQQAEPPPAPPAREIDDELVSAWQEVLHGDADRLGWLVRHRGLSLETIRRYRIGWDNSRYTIPILDDDERPVNVRRYRRDADPKMLSFRVGFGSARLFPLDAFTQETIYLFAGEWDALLARDRGINSVTGTGGEGTWKDEWTPLFAGKHVVLVYDTDRAGREAAQTVITYLLPVAASLKNVLLDLTAPHKDFTDHIVEAGRSVEDFHHQVAATPVEGVEARTEEASTVEPDTRSEADRVIDEFNERHFMLLEGGKAVVMREHFSEELKRRVLIPINRSEFIAYYGNRFVSVRDAHGETVRKPVGRYFIDHPRRRSYERVDFAPNRTLPPEVYNTWRGYGTEPATGDWSLFRWHLLHVICSGVEAWYRYLIRWMAFALQFPERRSEVAVVLRGLKGSGKGTVGWRMKRLLGQHGVYISQPTHLTGRFNAHLRDAALLFVDEAFFAGDKEAEGVLKSLITEEVLMIERKGVDVVEVVNRLSILMATNAEWAVPATRDERRYFVLNVSTEKCDDPEYFRALRDEDAAGGAGAFLHDMLAMDLSDFDHRHAPVTAALGEQVEQSFRLEERWWHERLLLGRPISVAPIHTPDEAVRGWTGWEGGSIEVAKEDLHQDYLDFARRHQAPTKTPRATQTKIATFLRSSMPVGERVLSRERAARTIDGRTTGDTFVLPDLRTCRSGFSRGRPGLFPEETRPE